jgi:enoyl-CoA hydratase/carnithine racemase
MPDDASPPRVKVTVDAGVADVRLNRPDKLNALDPAMFDALVEAGARLSGDRSVRAVVLSGEGPGFCSGLDLAAFRAMAAPHGVPAGTARLGQRAAGRVTTLAQQAAFVWAELAVPVIAALHGVALGGGLQIALAADVRIVAGDARLALLEIRWGLVPDMTGTWTLPRLVPLDVAKELTWTGRTVSGEEAVRLGLATRLSDTPRAAALALAAELAASNPAAIRTAKRLLNQSRLAGEEQHLRDEAERAAALIGSPNQVEAVAAYFERRAPLFTDPT